MSVSLNYSTIQENTGRSEELERAMQEFLQKGGAVEVISSPQIRILGPHAWNRNDMNLPGSSDKSQAFNIDAALAKQIKDLAERGAGISSMKHRLRVDPRRIKRIAIQFGIEIPSGRKGQVIEPSEEAHRKATIAKNDARKERWASYVQTVKDVAMRRHNGEKLSLADMSQVVGVSTRTLRRIASELGIPLKVETVKAPKPGAGLEKRCSCCGITKEVESFRSDASKASGLRSICRPCEKLKYQERIKAKAQCPALT